MVEKNGKGINPQNMNEIALVLGSHLPKANLLLTFWFPISIHFCVKVPKGKPEPFGFPC